MTLTITIALLGAVFIGGGVWLASRPVADRPVHLSRELLAAAKEAAANEYRTVEQQIELWAWKGRDARSADIEADRGVDLGPTGKD